MYLHLGQESIVRTRDILGIFDLDTASLSRHTRDYLAAAEKAGRVVTVTGELPKSFIVTTGESPRRIHQPDLRGHAEKAQRVCGRHQQHRKIGSRRKIERLPGSAPPRLSSCKARAAFEIPPPFPARPLWRTAEKL